LTLRSFNVDIAGHSNLKLTLSTIDDSYDVCYRNAYIQKAAFAQKLLKGIIEAAISISESGV